jgi:membrane-associated phospholipid phosphatase
MNSRLTILLMVACFTLLTFTGFSWYIKKGGFKNVDFDLTVKLQNRLPVIERIHSDELIEDLGFFVSPTVSVIVVVLLTAGLAIDGKKKRFRWGAFLIPICFGLMTLAEIYGKSVVLHPAPPFFMLKNPTTIFPAYHVIEQYSYPSGHAARVTFFTVIGIWVVTRVGARFNLGKILGCASLLGFTLFTSIGKIYLGHHWASDVIGGILLGIAMGSLSLVGLIPNRLPKVSA